MSLLSLKQHAGYFKITLIFLADDILIICLSLLPCDVFQTANTIFQTKMAVGNVTNDIFTCINLTV